MNLFTALQLLCLSWVTMTESNEGAETGEVDFVPNFFGGRRNEGENSGMDPPHQSRPKTRSGTLVRTLNFTQRLDHFDKCNKRVWSQRYMVNDAYFEPRMSGPIFIRIGGEGKISEYDLEDGPMITLAMEHKALVLSLEHRFYGESKPTPDLTPKSLRYLSSKQALADLEAFIISIKKEYQVTNPNANVVLYGCSYAGSLAAFHRRLYPNSTAGAIAGFAPLVAVANFEQYFNGFWHAVSNESEECRDETLETMYQAMCLAPNRPNAANPGGLCDEYGAHTPSERNAMFHDAIDFCEPKQFNLTDPNAFSSMVYDLYARLLSMAQYNIKQSDGSSDLGTFCRYMVDTSRSRLARYGAWRREVDGRCVIHNGRSIQTRAPNWNSEYGKSARQWLYQMCSEFGYFVADASGALVNISYHMQTCQKSFGIVDVEGNVKRTNDFYKGHQVTNLTNVYFLSSEADPWFYANLLGDTASRNPAIRVNTLRGISHCHEPIDNCSEASELVDAWNDIANYVAHWIGKPRKDSGIFSRCAQF